MRLPRWLTHRVRILTHPNNGYIIHAESRRITGILTNVCVWDGTQWHQAPLAMWNKGEGIDYLGIWIRAHLPLEAFDSRR